MSQALKIEGNGSISFYEDTGNTPKFFWDALEERLGIGNAAPTTALDVTGTVTADGLLSGTTATYEIGSSSNLWANAWLKNGGRVYFGDTGTAIYGSSSLDIITFSTATSERMRIGSSGNVGIGTDSPDKLVHIERNDTSTAASLKIKNSGTGDATIQVGTSSTNVVFGVDNSDSDKFKLGFGSALETAGDFVLDSSGNVGIGTDSPTTALTVSTDGTEQLTINRADASISTGNTVGTILFTGDDPSANQTGARIQILAAENWSTNAYGSHITFSNDSSGTLHRAPPHRLIGIGRHWDEFATG
jgi:hypothetical protein